jgi:peptidoglycan/LPS O-acetylase OafA/YrhL
MHSLSNDYRIPLVPSELRPNNFDALRLAMAVLVVWSHCFALGLAEGERIEPISIITNGHYNAGNIGVLAFFAISGFLICESYLKSKDARSFFVKRIRRIYPAYMVATTIGAFVVAPLFSTMCEISTTEIAKTFGLNLLLKGYAPPSTVFARNFSQTLNGSLWSITFEFWCYIGIAALGVVGLLTQRRLVLGVIVLALAGRAVLDLLDKKPGLGLLGDIIGWPYEWFLILPCFLIGTALFLLRDQLPRKRLILIALVACFLVACYAPVGFKWQKILAEATFPFAMAYSVFYIAYSNTLRLDGVAVNGDFSYGTYLYAFPIQQMLLSTLIVPFPLFVMLSVILSLTAGFLSWNLVEKWFLHRKRHENPTSVPTSVDFSTPKAQCQMATDSQQQADSKRSSNMS